MGTVVQLATDMDQCPRTVGSNLHHFFCLLLFFKLEVNCQKDILNYCVELATSSTKKEKHFEFSNQISVWKSYCLLIITVKTKIQFILNKLLNIINN